MGILYVVATPIGNLEDLSPRAAQALRAADLIAAEDTRVTGKLLIRLNIVRPLVSSFQHSPTKNFEKVLATLTDGLTVALVTDAGTPGISDPGGYLVSQVRAKLPDCQIIPIPVPNAAATALSISGFSADQFLFLGFPPHKKGRQTFFKELAESKYTVVIYESPHRILKTLAQLPPERQIFVARELTKKFESHYFGTPVEIAEKYISELERGELVVVISAK
ncbi:MAG TPA: 16S rRNA (cytidine(1402)-2'-O)-methyltransferase [Candidatus Paceibacterota bacterium]|nr:16S rRNA (cytidine(1402)-2'-O)-methyltransferase [Candidatus Paceibacterota bacterium]